MSDLAIYTGCTDDGGLTIDGLSMRTPAWYVLSLMPLWQYGNVRGEDRLIPGFNANPDSSRWRIAAPTDYQLPMLIVGAVNQSGVANADPWVGLQTNIDALRAVLDPYQATYVGGRSAVLTMPSGATRTATVHTGLTLAERPDVATARQVVLRATLDLTVMGPFL